MEQEKKKDEDLTLEESFAKLEELLLVLEKLDTVEKKMQMINEEGDYCDFPG